MAFSKSKKYTEIKFVNISEGGTNSFSGARGTRLRWEILLLGNAKLASWHIGDIFSLFNLLVGSQSQPSTIHEKVGLVVDEEDFKR